jgi:hypothetical protein
MTRRIKLQVGAAALVLLALLLAPAPLRPPAAVAEALKAIAGSEWKSAYIVLAVTIQVFFYGGLGLLAMYAVKRARTPRDALMQLALVSSVIVALALVIRTVKLGHVPMATHAIIPAGACVFGASVGYLWRRRGWQLALATAGAFVALTLAGFVGDVSSGLGRETQARLRQLVALAPQLPSGDARFAALVEAAFAPLPEGSALESARDRNRASILALGIALGHERIARYTGLDEDDALVQAAIRLRDGATLRGRGDWSRHHTVSAALAVLRNPLLSDTAGVVKEQLDTLDRGSGFSFGDLAADRAGARLAEVATRSERDAAAIQARLQRGFVVDDYFPPAADLPEDLSASLFRQQYGDIGDSRYRLQLAAIDARLDQCAGLSLQP